MQEIKRALKFVKRRNLSCIQKQRVMSSAPSLILIRTSATCCVLIGLFNFKLKISSLAATRGLNRVCRCEDPCMDPLFKDVRQRQILTYSVHLCYISYARNETELPRENEELDMLLETHGVPCYISS